MVVSEAVRSRLLAWLRPWVAEQPELELKLGFLKSHVVAKNLNFDAAALNPLIEESTRLLFKEVIIKDLQIEVSPWKNPSLVVNVHGVDVVLAPRECSDTRHFVSKDSQAKRRKEIIGSIDPVGSLLHEIIERISLGTTSTSRFMTSLSDAVLRSCQVIFHSIRLQLQFMGGSYTCILEVNRLACEPPLLHCNSLLKGFLGSLLLPDRVSMLEISCHGLFLHMRDNVVTQTITSLMGLSIGIRFNDLQPRDFGIQISHVDFKLSPMDIPLIMIVLDVLSPKESKVLFGSRDLWKLAKLRLLHFTFNPLLSWHKVVNTVLLWIRYVGAYESLLLLIGYRDEAFFEEKISKISSNKKLVSCIASYLRLTHELENKLPAHTVARARRVARHRILSLTCSDDSESAHSLLVALLQRSFTLFSFILTSVWRFMGFLFYWITLLLSSWSIYRTRREVGKVISLVCDAVSDGPAAKLTVSMNLEKLQVTLSPVDTEYHARDSEEYDFKLPTLKPPLFNFQMTHSSIVWTSDLSTKSFMFAIGGVNLYMPLSSTNVLIQNDSRLIVWSDPALTQHILDRVANRSANSDVSLSVMANSIKELWSYWTRISRKCEEMDIQYSKSPFFLCEYGSFLKNPLGDEHGQKKFSLAFGKLNVSANDMFILAIVMLYSQVNYCCDMISRVKGVSSQSSSTEVNDISRTEGVLNSYITRMKFAILDKVPAENIIAVGLFTGPRIRMSSRIESQANLGKQITGSEAHPHNNANYSFVLDMESIEFAIWPIAKTDLAALTSESHFNVLDSEHIWSKKPLMLELQKARDEKWIWQDRIAFDAYMRCHSLTVLIENSGLNQKDRPVLIDKSGLNQKDIVLGPISVEFQSSSCRDCMFSLFQTVTVFSMILSGVATGVGFILYLDEVAIFVQILADLIFLASSMDNGFEQTSLYYLRGSIRKLLMSSGTDLKMNTVEYGARPLDISEDSQVIFDVMFTFQRMGMLLNGSRTDLSEKSSRLPVYREKIVSAISMPCMVVFLPRSSFQISCRGSSCKVLSDISGVHSIISNGPCNSMIWTSMADIEALLRQTCNELCILSLCDCLLSINVGSGSDILPSMDETDVMRLSDSLYTARGSLQNDLLESDTRETQLLALSNAEFHSSLLVVAEFVIGELSMLEYCRNNKLTEEPRPSKLKCLIFVSEEKSTLTCNIEGCYAFLETPALASFFHWPKAYLRRLTSGILYLYSDSSSKTQHLMVSEESEVSDGDKRDIVSPVFSLEKHRMLFSTFSLNISQVSITLACLDEFGGAQELTLEAEGSIKLTKSGMKFLLNFNRLAVRTKHLRKFTSQMSDVNDDGALVSYSCPVNYILEHAAASVDMEKPAIQAETRITRFSSDWVGTGSIAGFDLRITLSQIQLFLSLLSPFGELPSVSARETHRQIVGSGDEEDTGNLECLVPDGSIVAIMDLHQHSYFAIESVNGKYEVAGTLHYSLVGERALFKVKYHNTWRSRVPLFSLISVYAKDDNGVPLRLNCCRGSGFVMASAIDDKNHALWQTTPYKPDRYEHENDVESYSTYSSKAFHLLNQKNKCGVAFVDDLPEFVKKPGNPFKAKVLNMSSLPVGLERSVGSNVYDNDNSGAIVQGELPSVHEENLGCSLQYIDMAIDKVSLTILHEVSDENDKLPLLQCSVTNIHVIGQLLTSKLRVLGSLDVSANYFDAQRNLWKEVISPVYSCFFLRYRISSPISVNLHQKVPLHFYYRMRQMDISVTEVSWDIILYLAGRLDIVGPYAVRNSVIFANCCKVENNSGLSLRCQFAHDQNISLAGRQSASIFLRHATMAGNLQQNDDWVSVCLSADGLYATSPLTVPLSAPHILAWRTRIVSLHESRSFPGPFVVIEVSRNAEEGLSVLVSPILKIHNESGFPLELQFRRPQETETEYIMLKPGEAIDDSTAAFDALKLSGSSKRTLMSLSLGNFLLSIKPLISEECEKGEESLSAKWSGDLKGGKAVRVAGIFDRLNYRFRKAFGVESVQTLFSTLSCPIFAKDQEIGNLHFLIKTIRRDVPIMQSLKGSDTSEHAISPVALQVQKEIFIYPTFQVHNLLQLEIHILLTECHPDQCKPQREENFGNEAVINGGSSTYLCGNPSIIYFTVTLTAYDSKCKPVNTGDWVKKLEKQKRQVQYLDMELKFDGGKYFASLRLSRASTGTLEVTIFTSYTLQNDSELSFYCTSPNLRHEPWSQVQNDGSCLPPESGCLLPPMCGASWFLKSNKVHFRLLEDNAPEALLDLNNLSGFTELCLEAHDDAGINRFLKLGVSLQQLNSGLNLPSHVVHITPRYVISNESRECIIIRQYHLEDTSDGDIFVDGGQKHALLFRSKKASGRRKYSVIDQVFRSHRDPHDNSLIYVQFCLKDSEFSWSGPVCVSSLGRFFVKFKKVSDGVSGQPNITSMREENSTKFAVVQIAEENASMVLRFHMPPDAALPYRIENCLRGTSILYHQEDSTEPSLLRPGNSEEYVWDDITLPHKLVVQIVDLHLSRVININKVRTWKPLYKIRQNKGLIWHSPLDNLERNQSGFGGFDGLEMSKVGYEVYADGLTRVLRICVYTDRYKEEKIFLPSANIQFRMLYFALHLLEKNKQDTNANEPPNYSTIMVAKLANIAVDSLITDQYKYNALKVQSLSVDEKWQGAPFASMVRRSQLQDSANENVLHITIILNSANSDVKQVRFSSILLQPIDVKVDEETLMKLVPFWRSSLSSSGAKSRQFYFEHFEIHPIKITASFIPGNPHSSYSSAQEALRSLIHSVIKVPTINNTVVELNGILLTHALLTSKELLIKCAQHYSWYVIRAIYIAKGSPLLPPAFASIFDDTAASSLDVFFDPSDGSINLPGLTLGMFKFVSRCINSKEFSGTKRYFGDLRKTVKAAGSNIVFAAMTEISDSVLKGAEASGFNGMIIGFHQGLLKLAMEPSLLGAAVMEGGPDRKIKLDHSPGVDELYVEGYLQAMLDVMYKQEYLRVRVIENQVILKNLPPNSHVISEIMENVRSFLVSKALLKGDTASRSRPLRHLRSESDWRIGPTVLTLCEHLFVSFSIRILRKEADKFLVGFRGQQQKVEDDKEGQDSDKNQGKLSRSWAVGKFALGGIVAYMDGWLCRHIPHPIARRIVSGFLLSFLDRKDAG